MKRTNKNGESKESVSGQSGEVLEIAIADVIIEPTVNVRHDALDLDTVDAYSQSPNLPPISVMLVEGKHYLCDGEHRLHATSKRGDKTIKAIVVGSGTLDDVRDYSDLANLTHGLPLTRQQRREVARRLHARHEWSNRELAKRMGVTHPTIALWLQPEATGKNLPAKKSPAPSEESSAAVEVTPAPPTGGETSETRTITCPKCGNEIPLP